MLKRKLLKKRICPVCDAHFRPTNPRQMYDKRKICGQRAYRFRLMEKLQRLQEFEQAREAI